MKMGKQARRESKNLNENGSGRGTGWKIGIRWWQGKALSTLGKEITPSFECTLRHIHTHTHTHMYNEWLSLTRGNLLPSVSAENCLGRVLWTH